nr:hypothetical protein BaRGS_003735 [Batillaria attramentaria]
MDPAGMSDAFKIEIDVAWEPTHGNPGLKVDFGDDPEPIDVYRFFINDEIIHHIKRETNRFLAILAFLHVNDNATYVPYGQPDHDPIHKIRPFMSHLQKKFAEAYVPEQKIALDEAMCPFKGRLMDPLLHKGYHVYMDNYYCYEPLCNHLAGHGATMVCGTARKDGQTLPKKDFVNIPIEKGRLDYRRKDQVVLTKWRDKRDVLSLSTMDKPELVRTQGRFELKEKPRCVVNYIQHMAGVDNSDQLISYLPMHRKTLKWWKKPFFYLLTLTTIQTLILTNKHREIRNRKKLSLEDVVKSLLLAMPVGVEVVSPQNAAAGPRQPEARLEGGLKCHYASPVPESTTHTRKAYRNCKVCYDKLKKIPDMTRRELRKRRKITSFWLDGPRMDPAGMSDVFKIEIDVAWEPTHV